MQEAAKLPSRVTRGGAAGVGGVGESHGEIWKVERSAAGGTAGGVSLPAAAGGWGLGAGSWRHLRLGLQGQGLVD